MDNKNIMNVGAGILSGLESLDNIGVEGENSKIVKENKSKILNGQKSKRSFMLTEDKIKMLYEIKYKYINKDLSEIVGEAIEEYYKKVKD